MTERKVRGLEDREAQERKNLLRDVRTPVQRLVDTLKSGTVQTSGVFGAGVCLLLFPVAATPFFGLGLFFFVLRYVCVNYERLPFRMPLGLLGTDRGAIPCPAGAALPSPKDCFSLAIACRTAWNCG